MNERIYEEIDFDIDLLLKMSGVILRKAEMENDFERVYTRVLEQIVKMQFMGVGNMVEILGEVGG